MRNRHNSPFIVLSVLIASSGFQNTVADIITFTNDQTGWLSNVGSYESELAADFGPAPLVADNLSSVSRSGTLFSYTIENRDTLADINNANLISRAGGTVAGLYHDTDATLSIENPISQGTASTGNWGVDSRGTGNNNSVSGLASRNAAVFRFGSDISAFNLNLIDFEASLGQEGLLVLADNGLITHTQDLDFNDGDGVVTNFGIIAGSGKLFDQAIFVLGDDNDSDLSDGYGGREFFATGDAIVGLASSTAAVPEPSQLALIGLLGGAVMWCRRQS